MHLIQDVVKAFRAWEAHTNEHAIEQTYKMGYDAGVADTEAKFKAGLGGTTSAPVPAAPAAETGASDEEKGPAGTKEQTGKDAKTAKGSPA